MLTQKQKDLLLFIHERLESGEIAPSFEEMKKYLGLKSKSGVHRLVTALVERGYLERLPHRARALHVKKLPPGTSPDQSDTSAAAQASAAIAHVQNQARMAMSEIPLYGKIAAGTPIEAIRHEGESLSLPPDMLGHGEYYALKVEGDSMIEAGIHDADTVIIKRSDTCHDGEIVVALVDDQEATLKRVYTDKDKIRLVPENKSYEVRELPANRVKVQGVLKSLLRSY